MKNFITTEEYLEMKKTMDINSIRKEIARLELTGKDGKQYRLYIYNTKEIFYFQIKDEQLYGSGYYVNTKDHPEVCNRIEYKKSVTKFDKKIVNEFYISATNN